MMNLSALNSVFFWMFLCFYLLHEILELGLDLLNFKHTKSQTDIPDFFKDKISTQQFERTKEYTLTKLKFGIFSHFCKQPFFWALIFLNGFQFLDSLAAQYTTANSLSHSVLFCFLIGMYFSIISLPFGLYSTFVIEERFGFNKMTFKTFLVDLVKSSILGITIGVPLLYLVFWFMQKSGNLWWLWVWGSITAFQLLISAIYPTFIAPIFNKFTPLEDGELKNKITELAHKIKFKMSGIFTIDGSKRSAHSNAYFAGMGKFRRIVLFDTLRKQLSDNELLAVLAHEMGHNVKKHILKSTLLSTIMSLIGLFVMSLLMKWPDFYTAFNINTPSAHTAFIIFGLSSGTFTFPLTPIMNLLSRKYEYEADQFAAEQTQNPQFLKTALVKLTKENLSNLAPHPLYSFFHYSHPTTEERAKKLDDFTLNS